MASNTTLNSGSGGDLIATKERTHDGDATKVQVVTLAGVTGTEGAYTYGDINGDATNGLDVDVTRTSVQGNVDTAAGATQIGVVALAVRDDALATLVEADNDLTLQRTNARGATWVALDSTAAQTVTLAASTGTQEVVGDAAHDAVASGNPILNGGYASAAAPTDVSADGDAVRQWHLRNGSQVVNLAAAGSLIGATSNALDMNIKSGGIAGLAEDAVAAGGEDGVMVLAVRRDSASSGVSADGDFAALSVDSNGALRVSGASGTTQYTEDVASAGAESLCLVGAVRRDTAASSSGADGDYSTLNTDANGRLHVITGPSTGTIEIVGDVAHDAVSAGNPVLVAAYASAAAPTNVSADGDTTHLWALRSGALAVQPTYGGVLATTDNGVSGTGVLRVTIASDSTGQVAAIGGAAQDAAIAGNPVPQGMRASTATPTAMSADGDVVYPWATREGAQVIAGAIVDDSAFTPGTSRVVPIGFQADETATDSVDEGDAGTPRMTLDRKVIVTPYAHAAGGATPYKNLDVDETEDDIKTSAGKLYWLHVINLANAKRYLHIYNSVAASVTVGTTAPDLTFPIPTMGDTNGAGFTINFGDIGLQFSTGICIAATTGFADNDSGAPGTNEVILNAGYS